MANPKRRFSKSRTRKRRSIVFQMPFPAGGSCPNCKQPKLPHRICRNCGFYAGRSVLLVGD
ncbi:MAG: 50S ribosomal protein L32 [bacterium]